MNFLAGYAYINFCTKCANCKPATMFRESATKERVFYITHICCHEHVAIGDVYLGGGLIPADEFEVPPQCPFRLELLLANEGPLLEIP